MGRGSSSNSASEERLEVAVFYFQLLVAAWHVVKLTPLATFLLSLWGYLLSYIGIDYEGYGQVKRAHKAECTTFLSPQHKFGFITEGPFSTMVDGPPHDAVQDAHYNVDLCHFKGNVNGYDCQLSFEDPVITCKIKGSRRIVRYNVTDASYWRALTALFQRARWSWMLKGKENFFANIGIATLMHPFEICDECLLHNKAHQDTKPERRFIFRRAVRTEEKLLSFLNLASIYANTYNVYLRCGLTLVSILLDLSSTLRSCIYNAAKKPIIIVFQFIVDGLFKKSIWWRYYIYGSGKFVEGLSPCNDILMRVDKRQEALLLVCGNLKYENVELDGSRISLISHEQATMDALWTQQAQRIHGFELELFVMALGDNGGALCVNSRNNKIWDAYLFCSFAGSVEEHKKLIFQFLSALKATKCSNIVSLNGHHAHCLGIEESYAHFCKNHHPQFRYLKLSNVVNNTG